MFLIAAKMSAGRELEIKGCSGSYGVRKRLPVGLIWEIAYQFLKTVVLAVRDYDRV